MRARNIKPGFFLNEHLGKCSPLARLLFLGLWSEADWQGRLEYRPGRLRAQILPYDFDADIGALVNELVAADPDNPMLQIYGGGKYLFIPGFTNHQNPHPNERKYPSKLPVPESFGNVPVMDGNDNGTLQERSCNGREQSGKVLELHADSLNPDSLIPDTTATAARPGKSDKPKSTKAPDPNIARILRAYAHACTLRPDWIPQPGPPTTKEAKRLIALRASEADFVEGLGAYVKQITALDWAEAKDLTFFLRRRTFDACASGEYSPSRKNGKPAKDPECYDWATEQKNNMLREKGIIP